MYDSDCHSQTSSCPCLDDPKANHSPVVFIVIKSILLCYTLCQVSDFGAQISCTLSVPELVNHVKLRQLVQPKQTVREADDEQIRWRVKGSTVQFGVILHEKVLFDNSPTKIRFGLFFCPFRNILPSKESAVLAYSVYLPTVSLHI
jgi:hypothetical protein